MRRLRDAVAAIREGHTRARGLSGALCQLVGVPLGDARERQAWRLIHEEALRGSDWTVSELVEACMRLDFADRWEWRPEFRGEGVS